MELKELKIKLEEFIKDKKFDTLEGQNEQNVLMSNLESELNRLMEGVIKYSNIQTNRNHIYITSGYPLYSKLADLKVTFKKGDKYTFWDYKQCYYINTIEITSEYDITTTYGIARKIEENKREYDEMVNNKANELKEFMEKHNISKEELAHIAYLYHDYKYAL